MRKAVLSILFIGLAGLCFAQERNGESAQVNLDEVTVKPLNIAYVNSVKEKNMPPSVHELEGQAAQFDVRDLRAYKKNYEAFEVFFKQHNGSIVATYNRDGQILESYEKFKNIALPPKVRNHLYLEYPGWIISKDVYMVSYYGDSKVQKLCKVQLERGKLKRNLTLDLDKLN